MMTNDFNLREEQKKLVLARFKTLHPQAKIVLGGENEMTVKDLIGHIEKNDDFGKKVIQVQMNMIKILTRIS